MVQCNASTGSAVKGLSPVQTTERHNSTQLDPTYELTCVQGPVLGLEHTFGTLTTETIIAHVVIVVLCARYETMQYIYSPIITKVEHEKNGRIMKAQTACFFTLENAQKNE